MVDKRNCQSRKKGLAPLAGLAAVGPNRYRQATRPSFLTSENAQKMPQELWLTPAEAALHLGISQGSLRNKVSNGQVPRHKLGRLNRFLRSELDRLLLKDTK